MANLAPFHRSKNSVADGLLIEIFAEAADSAVDPETEFIFVTHNTKDFSQNFGDRRVPHAHLESVFASKKRHYATSIVDAVKQIDGEMLAEYEWDRTFSLEPRRLSEILDAEHLLFKQVWYNRHMNLRCKVEGGDVRIVTKERFDKLGGCHPEVVVDSIWQGAPDSARRALSDQDFANTKGPAAQCCKNLGVSLERLGEQNKAIIQYRKALKLNPDLPEAHYAVGRWHLRHERYQEALDHFDQVAFTERELGMPSSVAGWRVNILFNLGDGRAAFREINGLMGSARSERWIWPWCARQVAGFGRASVANARLALGFWQRYLEEFPEDSAARRELLLANFYLRSNGMDIGKSYADFRDDFAEQINGLDADGAAFLWDRLGHWAQDEKIWEEAERCYRNAYELAGGDYGYCLGTALNSLDRFDESLPLLLEQAQVIQPDAKSWFQVGSAYANLGQAQESIDAYERALALDPDHDLAMFDLGGAHWNSGDRGQALIVWRRAMEKIPNHELTARLRREFPVPF